MELEPNVGERLVIVSIFQECQSMHLEFSSCKYKHSSFSQLLQDGSNPIFSSMFFLKIYFKLPYCSYFPTPSIHFLTLFFVFCITFITTEITLILLICLLAVSSNQNVCFMKPGIYFYFIYCYIPMSRRVLGTIRT